MLKFDYFYIDKRGAKDFLVKIKFDCEIDKKIFPIEEFTITFC